MAVWYLLASRLGHLLGVFSLIVISRVLTPAEYGHLSVTCGLSAILLTVLVYPLAFTHLRFRPEVGRKRNTVAYGRMPRSLLAGAAVIVYVARVEPGWLLVHRADRPARTT